jgi:HlyD family secretion protein
MGVFNSMKGRLNKKSLLILSGLAFLVIVAGGVLHFMRREGPDNPFVLRPVQRGVLHRTVTATGRLNALKTVHVGTQVSGIITRIDVDFNSRVRKGQILAQIDPAIYRAQVAQAESNLSKIDTKILLDRVQIRRDQDLLKHHIIAESTFDTDRAQLMMDMAEERQLAAALKLARTDLSYTTIRSPIDGVVIARKVQIGQTVTSAFKTPRLFTIAHDLREMRLDTRVSEADIGAVAPGQPVSFQVPAYARLTFSGSVTMVRDHPRTVSHVVTYDVISTVPNPKELLKPGMTAMVTIHTGELAGALLVPNGAFVYRPPKKYLKEFDATRKKGESVIFVLKKGKAVPVDVRIGPTDGLVSAVTGPVSEGDQVIVRDRSSDRDRSGGIFP